MMTKYNHLFTIQVTAEIFFLTLTLYTVSFSIICLIHSMLQLVKMLINYWVNKTTNLQKRLSLQE